MAQGNPKKNIIAYVVSLPPGAAESIRAYSKREKQKLRIMLIIDSRTKGKDKIKKNKDFDILIEVDFSKPHKIASALLPYQDELRAITCRTESHMAKFAAVLPHVPYLRTPSTESIEWASDKLKMRKRFALYDKSITPKYTAVKENSKKERKRIIEKIGFPMVVKPANLAQSLLVSICYHEEELDKALRSSFRKIKKIYGENGRTELPTLMAEEYMEGTMYSVDAYVNSRGTVYFCPLVRTKTGKEIGHDDFYGYLQMTPTVLKKNTVEKAREVAEKGVHALGLRNTTAHIELMKLEDDWKIVEIGARVGGFRPKLHQLSCDIDHSLNDVLIRLPKKPVIPKKCKGYAAAMKWYPKKEGVLTKLQGIKKIQELKSFVEISEIKKLGDRCRFAKNGGKAVFKMVLYNKDRAKLLADIRRIEQLVDIKIK
ncbi:ATP-grasp domain-containing protein [Candidatus Kaiserbacteria bacterium]|nr:ATP-grasp domain-containing protein [Candidatus Kaiserbacteria bacterium]